MKAFHNDIEVKAKYLGRVEAHRKADEIVKGKYWSGGKGCAVGCTIHSSSHALYETELGIPQILAKLEDGIFENLPNGLAMTWPERFLSAITVGADLSGVWDKFAYWMLVDKKWGVLQFAKTDRTKKSIKVVVALYKKQISGKTVSREEWHAADAYAAYAADAADAYAAYAADAAAAAAADAAAADADAAAAAADADADAADAAAAAAAAADADAAADAAADAYAYAYAYAYAADAARTKWRIAQSEKLIELLKACK